MQRTLIEDSAAPIWKSYARPTGREFTLTTISPRHFFENGDPDGWGPFMLLHPRTARLLQLYCGESLEQGKEAHHPVLRLRAQQYFGSYEAARSSLTKLKKGPTRAWSLYCGSLDEYIRRQFGHHSRELENEIDMIVLSRLKFLSRLQLARMYLQILGDLKNATKWLASAASTIADLPSDLDRQIARTRLVRYQSEIGSVDIISFLESENVQPSTNLFLKESTRRLCDFHTLANLKSKDWAAAEHTAQIALSIDPHCSRAAFLLAEAKFHGGEKILSKRLYIQASFSGFDERDMAEARLHGFAADVLKREPIVDEAFPTDNLRAKILNSPRYKELGTFWNPDSMPIANSPLLTYTPYSSLQSYNDKRDPFFHTLTCQRVTSPRFRAEMINLMVQETDYRHRVLDKAVSIEFWATCHLANATVFEQVQRLADLDTVSRCRLARYISALGFSVEARAIMNLKIGAVAKFDIEQAYEYSTWIFLREICENSSVEEIVQQMNSQFPKIPSCAETLRIRLTLIIFACVYFGNNRRPLECAEWKFRGLAVLKEIQNSTCFSTFEKELLTSRFYRAGTYASLMSADRETLQREVGYIENYARGLAPSTAHEEILARENMYPMLETSSRIWTYLGDKERAYHLMKEIAAEIDPYDAKAWLQSGEVELQKGDTEAALAAYLRAGTLGLPMGRIAWYKSGRLFEKRGELEQAVHCYVKSVRVWPLGPSPLMRISALAPRLGWNSLALWASDQLRKIPT